jgi:hypothetical protein
MHTAAPQARQCKITDLQFSILISQFRRTRARVIPLSANSLKRTIGSFEALLITLSNVTPAVSVFAISPSVIQQSGTGAFLFAKHPPGSCTEIGLRKSSASCVW